MKINRRLKAFITCFLAIAMLLCNSVTSYAYTGIDTSKKTSLEVHFGTEKVGFGNVEFRVYKVADVSKDVKFTLTGDFKKYPVEVNYLDSAQWTALATTLEGYIARDKISPDKKERTGRDGIAKFNDLSTGLYLVVGDRYIYGNVIYTPQAYLVSLPSLDQEKDQWIYDVVSFTKYKAVTQPAGGGEIPLNIKVIKVWENDIGEDRPKEVVVQLLRDNVVYDTVTLNEANNWRYNWTNLSYFYNWRITEYKVDDNYKVSVDVQGNTYIITNTFEPTTTITEDPPPPLSPPMPPDEYYPPDPPVPTSDVPPGLPQTGMLWWPVPILALAGLTIFLVGFGKYRNEK